MLWAAKHLVEMLVGLINSPCTLKLPKAAFACSEYGPLQIHASPAKVKFNVGCLGRSHKAVALVLGGCPTGCLYAIHNVVASSPYHVFIDKNH